MSGRRRLTKNALALAPTKREVIAATAVAKAEAGVAVEDRCSPAERREQGAVAGLRKRQRALKRTSKGDEATTWERRQHDELVPVQVSRRAGDLALRVETVRPIDRYLKRRHITGREFSAGDKLHELYLASGRVHPAISSYGQRVRGDWLEGVSDRQLKAYELMMAALDAVGPELRPILSHVVFEEQSARSLMQSWQAAPQAGIVVLKLALNALCRYWRI